MNVLHTVHPQACFVQVLAWSGSVTSRTHILRFLGVAEGPLKGCLEECREETMLSFRYSPLTHVAKYEDSDLKFCSLFLNGHSCLLKNTKVWEHSEVIKLPFTIQSKNITLINKERIMSKSRASCVEFDFERGSRFQRSKIKLSSHGQLYNSSEG